MILLCGSFRLCFRLCFRLFIGLYVRLRKLISLGCSTLVTSLGCLGSSFGPLVAGCLKNFLSYCYIATYRAMLTWGKTVFGTSRINSCIIDLGVAESGDYNVLSVGKLSESRISEYCVTVGAVPICLATVLMAGCRR